MITSFEDFYYMQYLTSLLNFFVQMLNFNFMFLGIIGHFTRLKRFCDNKVSVKSCEYDQLSTMSLTSVVQLKDDTI
jgi:hypothetical protein